MTEEPQTQRLKEAHRHSSRNRQEIECSSVCGCFYCGAQFPPDRVEHWLDSNDTAMCPECGTDSVIGSASGFLIGREFLQQMHDYWFKGVDE